MKVAVTGATGFVGRQLVPVLTGHGIEVIECSRKTGFDLSSDTDFAHLFAGCDAVVHLAALNNTDTADVQRFQQINVDGSVRVLTACEIQNVPLLVFASTSHAALASELNGAARFYASSKLAAEQHLLKASNGTRTVSLRLPPVYGRELAGGLAVLASLVKLRMPLPFGACRAPVPTLSVANLANGIEALCHAKIDQSQVFTIADSEPLSLRDIANALAERFAFRVHLLPVSGPLLASVLRRIGKATVAELVHPREPVETPPPPLSKICEWYPVSAWSEMSKAGN